MTKARLRLIALACVFLSAPLGASDELILNSGKTIHGKITAEDEDSYTVKLGSNMSLNVSKSDVARVMREPPPEPPKPQHPIRKKAAVTPPGSIPAASTAPVAAVSAAAASVEKKVAAPTPPAPAPPTKPVPPAPAADQSAPAVEDEAPSGNSAGPVSVSPELPAVHRTIGVVSLNQSTLKAFYTVTGATFDLAMKSITDSRRGKGFLVRGFRRPSRTKWRLSWYGTPVAGGTAWASLVVNYTITATLPAWKPRRDPGASETRRWDAMIRESEEVENNHAKIIEDAINSFATEVSNLTAPNEEELRIQTGKILSDARARSDNRRKGYDRRRTEMKRIIRKKAPHKQPS